MLVKVGGGLLARFAYRFIGTGVLHFAFRREGSGGPSFAPCPKATFSHETHCWPCGSIHNGSPREAYRCEGTA
jgi:hypothetical protein